MEDNPLLVDMCLVVRLIIFLTPRHSRSIQEAFIYRHFQCTCKSIEFHSVILIILYWSILCQLLSFLVLGDFTLNKILIGSSSKQKSSPLLFNQQLKCPFSDFYMIFPTFNQIFKIKQLISQRSTKFLKKPKSGMLKIVPKASQLHKLLINLKMDIFTEISAA